VAPVNLDLFDTPTLYGDRMELGPQAMVLRGFASAQAPVLLAEIARVEAVSPFRNMVTPGGFTMSVALTNCGTLGWTTDRSGYRYTQIDPSTGAPWPAMPESFAALARDAAKAAGFSDFAPDACLINRYLPGARMSLHQDRNEVDYDAPIVSVSLGVSARFLFGGHARKDPTEAVTLLHGDVVVWGGVDRLRFHGVQPLADATHPLVGNQRINFTFRKAG